MNCVNNYNVSINKKPNPDPGDVWVERSTGKAYVFDGTNWLFVDTTGSELECPCDVLEIFDKNPVNFS